MKGIAACSVSLLVALVSLTGMDVEAFTFPSSKQPVLNHLPAPMTTTTSNKAPRTGTVASLLEPRIGSSSSSASSSASSALFSSHREQDEDDNKSFVARPKRRGLVVALKSVALIVASSIAVLTMQPAVSEASAPVMALPKAEDRDPATEALHDADRRATARTQKQLRDDAATARKIEAEQGEGPRIKFEKQVKVRQAEQAVAKEEGLEVLKRDLLDQGIDPFTDMEGKRQLILYEKDVDLGDIGGTHWSLEKEWEKSAPKRSMAYKKATNRQIVACMARDMKNRGVDPLQYFEKHQDQTEAIMDMAPIKAASLLQQYQANMEQYGQITVPAEGEQSALEKMAKESSVAASKQKQKKDPNVAKAAKEEAKQVKAHAKAVAKEEAAVIKAAAKAAKAQAKEEAAAAKTAAKAAKAAALAGAAAAGASATAAMGATASSSASGDMAATQTLEYVNSDPTSGAVEEQAFGVGEDQDDSDYEDDLDAAGESAPAVVSGAKSAGGMMSKINVKDIPAVPAAAAVVVVGGGGYAFKLFRDKAGAEEEQRQRQFRMLMGEDDANGKSKKPSKSRTLGSAPALEEVDTDLFGLDGEDSSSPSPTPPSKKKKAAAKVVPEPVKAEVVAPKKKRMGLKSVFSKKSKDGRETKLAALVGPDAKAFEFAKTLAKILTFGAPGRFPAVVDMSGGMPMEDFDLELAKQTLIDSQASEDLSLEESAEIFANVVNCMLIAIVDLASSSLKEKDEKLTVDAVKIIVDFMNHAASLYDSIASGVSITPVTYNGDLSKSKLEQMYGAYAVSGMMNMGGSDDDFDGQVGLLCDVFQISEKKAEGIMMKAMQKNMMKMMKDGEGAEGMEEMMKNMGGMEGMGGMPGMDGMDGEGGEPDPEQLKEMLQAIKMMKDSGTLPPDELEQVKAQFRDNFGSSIDQVIKDADATGEEMDAGEKELLGLIKSILDD
jgi:hypothetical protein